jgi:hypothetical protein
MGADAGPEDDDRTLLACHRAGQTQRFSGADVLKREIVERVSKPLFFLLALQSAPRSDDVGLNPWNVSTAEGSPTAIVLALSFA